VRDELIGFFKTFNKDGYESARAFYLEAWDGNNSFISDRIGRGTQHIPAICISILGCIQPGPLSFYIYNACNENAGDDGLIQRFQLSVWPDSNSIWKNIDKPINKENKELLFSLIKKISEYSCEDPLNIPCIHFDEEAQIQFNNWLSELENELRNNTLEPYLESHLAKYRSLIPSLALIFEFIFCLNTTSIDPSNVSLNALQMAIQWAKYLRSHAERIYSSQKNYKLESAKNLLNKIKKGSIIEGVSIREVYSHHWSFLTSPNEVKDATEILENHGYIKLEKKGTFGRPSSIIKINPSLFKK
jgi:putative DNA primase/helicase